MVDLTCRRRKKKRCHKFEVWTDYWNDVLRKRYARIDFFCRGRVSVLLTFLIQENSLIEARVSTASSMILSLSELSQIFKNNSTFVVNSVTWKIHYAASNIPYYSLHTLGNHRQLERWNDMYIMHGCCWTLIATGARIKQQNTQTSILYAENLLPTWALNKYALHTMQRTGSLLLRVCLQLTNRYIWINQTQSTLLRKFSIYKLAARSMISIQLSVDIPYVETLD